MLVKIFGKVNKMLCVKIDTVSGKRETEEKIIEENRGGRDSLSNKDLSMRNKETENYSLYSYLNCVGFCAFQ